MTRAEILNSLIKLGGGVCGYTFDPSEWLTTRCDCKYGGPSLNGPTFDSSASEKTGCPELRTAYLIIKNLSEDEYEASYG